MHSWRRWWMQPGLTRQRCGPENIICAIILQSASDPSVNCRIVLWSSLKLVSQLNICTLVLLLLNRVVYRREMIVYAVIFM